MATEVQVYEGDGVEHRATPAPACQNLYYFAKHRTKHMALYLCRDRSIGLRWQLSPAYYPPASSVLMSEWTREWLKVLISNLDEEVICVGEMLICDASVKPDACLDFPDSEAHDRIQRDVADRRSEAAARKLEAKRTRSQWWAGLAVGCTMIFGFLPALVSSPTNPELLVRCTVPIVILFYIVWRVRK